MKKLYLLIILISLFSCTDDDCNGKATEINQRYDNLIAEEMSSSGVPDQNYIDSLEESRINELGHACDQTDVLPIPEPSLPQ